MRVFSGTTQIFRSAPWTSNESSSATLMGRQRSFLDLLAVPGYGWQRVPTTLKNLCHRNDERSKKPLGFPVKGLIFEGLKGVITDFRSGGHGLEGNQWNKTHDFPETDKVKVSGHSSLVAVKGCGFLYLKILQNLRSSDTSMYTFMQPDR